MWIIHYNLFALTWSAFLLLWLLLAGWGKPTAQAESVGSRLLHFVLTALVYILLFYPTPLPGLNRRFLPATPLLAGLGFALTALGLGFCVWARLQLGRNWSARVEVKRGHELIRRGPYRLVRHPIYSGLLLATLGTGLAVGRWCAPLALLLALLTFLYKIRREERFMLQTFGAGYEELRRQVKMLIPFVW